MATFNDMLTEVYAITKRPDLSAATTLAVKAATLKAHNSDYFPKDLFETGIAFSSAQYLQEIDYKTIIPRWRALSYLRKYDATSNTLGPFFEIINPTFSLDSYGVNKDDVCYLAGLQLKVRSSTQILNALLGCYRYPDTTVENYSSWIADEFPYAIVFDAIATIFKTIGYDEERTAYREMVLEQYAELKQQVVATGS